MFKRIVVAIDGSRTSRRAFESALELAATHGAVLQPYYVVENAPVYYDVPGYDPPSCAMSSPTRAPNSPTKRTLR